MSSSCSRGSYSQGSSPDQLNIFMEEASKFYADPITPFSIAWGARGSWLFAAGRLGGPSSQSVRGLANYADAIVRLGYALDQGNIYHITLKPRDMLPRYYGISNEGGELLDAEHRSLGPLTSFIAARTVITTMRVDEVETQRAAQDFEIASKGKLTYKLALANILCSPLE